MAEYDLRLIPFTGGHEGLVTRWYRDPRGVPTIGFGFTWKSRVFRDWWMKKHGRKFAPGDTISKSDAMMLLARLIATEYAPPVLRYTKSAKIAPTAHATAASIDMVYNCGSGALAWRWFRALIQGRVQEAARLYKVTATTAGGKRLPGLIRRRREGSEILQHNIWPSWVKQPANIGSAPAIERSMPRWWIGDDDFMRGLEWLALLGFYEGSLINLPARDSGIVAHAVLAFQKQHPQLNNDGVLGRATLAQLQRVVDLRSKAGKTGVGAGGLAGAGGADLSQDVTGYGDWLLWGGAVVLVIGALWLSWRYRDELALTLKTTFGVKS